MPEKEVTVSGVPSGDHECWCLLVTREDFVRVTGAEPDPEFDVGPFTKEGSPYRYMLYTDSLLVEDPKREAVVSISVKSSYPGA